MIRVKQTNPLNSDVIKLIDALDQYQLSIYPPESNHLDPASELSSENVYFAGAFDNEVLVGIGAVKYLQDLKRYAEIKRVYVDENHRGKGVSRLIMFDLENHAQLKGITVMRLETGIYQPEAIGLYENLGYVYRDVFGDYPVGDPMSVFMEKTLL